MNKMLKLSILSISLLTIMASAAIAPALQAIGEQFSDASSLMVQMVISLPAFFTIPVSLLTGSLVYYVRKKNIVLMGVVLYLVGGLGGFFANSITMLLVFRSILGIGVGFMLPLATGLIADFFEGKERSQMMGYATSFNNLGGIIATVFAGILAAISWRYPFAVYLLGFVTLLLVLFYLPKGELVARTKHKVIITKNVWLIGLAHFITILTFYAVPSGLAFYVSNKGLGSATTVGLLISLITLGSFLTGLIYSTVKERLGSLTAPIGISIISLGMLSVGFANSSVVLGLSLFVVGIGLGITVPNIYFMTSLVANKRDVTISLAIVSAFSFLGQFSSPIIMRTIQNVFNYNAVNSPFIISFMIGVFGLIGLLINKYIRIYKVEETE